MPAFEYFVDTNIFLRVIVKDDLVKVADCQRLVENIRSGKFRAATSHLVLAEVVWTCLSLYKLPKRDVVRLARGIVGIHHLFFEEEYNALRAFAFWEEHPVKFIDALIASHPLIAAGDITVISYDADFDKLGVKRVEPSELI